MKQELIMMKVKIRKNPRKQILYCKNCKWNRDGKHKPGCLEQGIRYKIDHVDKECYTLQVGERVHKLKIKEKQIQNSPEET